MESNYKVPLLHDSNNDPNITIMIDHDFTERYYEIHYFKVMDILAIIGGLNASIGPILGLFMPLFMLAYLFQLA